MDIKATESAAHVAASAAVQGRKSPTVPAEQAPVVTRKAPPPPAEVQRLDPALVQDLQDRHAAVAEQMRKYLTSISRDLEFQVDGESGDAVITVRDAAGNVIRQIPGEEAMRLMRRMNVQSGTFLDSIV